MDNWSKTFEILKNEEFEFNFIEDILKNKDAEDELYNELKGILESYDIDRTTNLDSVLDLTILLGELKSERSIPLFLKVLSYDEESVDIMLGDMLFEVFPYAIFKTGENHLEMLSDFIKNEKISEWNRESVLISLCWILKKNSEKKKAIIEIFRESFKIKILHQFLITHVFESHLKELEEIAKETFYSESFNPTYLSEDELEYYEESEIRYDSIEKIYKDLFSLREANKNYAESLEENSFMKGYGIYDGIENELPFNVFSDDNFEFPQPRQSIKIGRNEPCPCGSGKKYKKCCGK